MVTSFCDSRQAGSAVLVIGHGTRDVDGVAECLHFVQCLRDRLQADSTGLPLLPAFLELADPDIVTGIRQLAVHGARRVVAVPLFLFAAGHIKRDIPQQLDKARQQVASELGVDISIDLLDAIGPHPRFAEVVVQRLREADCPSHPDATSVGIVVLSRGNRDEQAWSDFSRLVDLVRRRLDDTMDNENRHGEDGLHSGSLVVAASLTGVGPRLEDALNHCLRAGCTRIYVMPYLWFTGFLTKALPGMIDRWQREHLDHQQPQIVLTRHLGVDEALIATVVERVQAALV
jgi:sirohydrochlorin cobaltochelatase